MAIILALRCFLKENRPSYQPYNQTTIINTQSFTIVKIFLKRRKEHDQSNFFREMSLDLQNLDQAVYLEFPTNYFHGLQTQ